MSILHISILYNTSVYFGNLPPFLSMLCMHFCLSIMTQSDLDLWAFIPTLVCELHATWAIALSILGFLELFVLQLGAGGNTTLQRLWL